jgi:hypothetical protein
LTTGLRRIDDHTLYAEVPMSDTAEQGTLDLCLQRPGSSMPFALWYGDGLPTSCDDNPFAPAATCEGLDDGSVVDWLEEKWCDEDEEVYERALGSAVGSAAHRSGERYVGCCGHGVLRRLAYPLRERPFPDGQKKPVAIR